MNDEPTDKQTAENGDDARNELGRYAPGNPGGPGRPRGEPNKINATVKADILDAYQQRGGIEWLRGLGDRDFIRLLEKIMPREIAANLRAMREDREQCVFTLNVPARDDVPALIAELLQQHKQAELPQEQAANVMHPPGQA